MLEQGYLPFDSVSNQPLQPTDAGAYRSFDDSALIRTRWVDRLAVMAAQSGYKAQLGSRAQTYPEPRAPHER